jgi:nucleotide-binding universal stress UspA family protein
MATDVTLPTTLDDLDPAVAAAVRGATTILVGVDDGTEEAFVTSRRVATSLASLGGARLVLLDRSDTTYADTPRVHELSREDLVDDDRRYLLDQLDDAAAEGVAVTAFQHSLPGDEAYTDAAKHLGADVLVVPDHIDSPGFFDRFKQNGVPERAVDAAPSGTDVLVVAIDGSVRLAT